MHFDKSRHLDKSRVVRSASAIALAAVLTVGLATAPAGAAKGQRGQIALTRLQAAGAAAIAKREAALTIMAGRVADAPACDTGGKIAAVIAADEPALTQLGAKIAADTDAVTAAADVRSIYDTYRVYRVVAQQAYATAACGRIERAATTLAGDQTKLETRVTAAATAGADMTRAKAALADMSTRMTTATGDGTSAQSSLAALLPDQGNATVEAQNATAVAAARAQIASARTELLAALGDARIVVQALKAAG